MHEHNVPPIFRHPGAVYINKRFASFGWGGSRITHGACCYILHGPNQSPLTDRSSGATVQGNSTIYELSANGCLVTATSEALSTNTKDTRIHGFSPRCPLIF